MAEQWEGQATPAAGSEELALDAAPGWPKVIGIIDVVWGAINISCIGCGSLALMMPMFFASQMQQTFPEGMPAAIQNPPISIWVSYIIGLLLSAFLIATGVTLLLRRPIARLLHLVWAVASMLSAAFALYAGWLMQHEINDWVQQHPDSAYAHQVQAGQAFQWIGPVLGVVLGFAWPIFCLIWFGAVKRDSKEIARGVESLV